MPSTLEPLRLDTTPLCLNMKKSNIYIFKYIYIYVYIYLYIYIYLVRSSEKKTTTFRKIFRHFAFINYINLYNKTYAKIHYKYYNNYKCYHRDKTNKLPVTKIID